MINVLTYLHDLDALKALMEALRADDQIKLIALSALPRDGKVLDALAIDACVLDFTEQKQMAIDFVSQLSVTQKSTVKMLLVLPDLERQLVETIKALLGNVIVLNPSFCIDDIMAELMKTQAHAYRSFAMHLDEAWIVAKEIQDMGIPLHLNGYRYIKTAVLWLYHNDEKGVTMKQLYKEVARLHNTTASRVEKAMRDAVDYAYRISNTTILIHGRKPTNSQLVHLLWERLISSMQAMTQAVSL